MGHFKHCLLLDATIMVSRNCPITGENVVITVKHVSGPHIKRTPPIKSGHQLESQNATPTFTVK